MNNLVYTNVLLRSARPSHPMRADAARAIGETTCPGRGPLHHPIKRHRILGGDHPAVEANGLGLSVADTVNDLTRLKGIFQILPDTPTIFTKWEAPISRHAVKGKEGHEARILASDADPQGL